MGFPGAPTVDVVAEEEPRHVDANTVMVQADEVCVHAQASTGCKEIRVYNAVVMTTEKTWYFSEENAQGLIFLVGALLATLGVHRGQLRLLLVIPERASGVKGLPVSCWWLDFVFGHVRSPTKPQRGFSW